jgi:hypothetical protein
MRKTAVIDNDSLVKGVRQFCILPDNAKGFSKMPISPSLAGEGWGEAIKAIFENPFAKLSYTLSQPYKIKALKYFLLSPIPVFKDSYSGRSQKGIRNSIGEGA